MAKELKTYKEKVYKILEKYENARNNDGSLLALYIYEFLPGLVDKTESGKQCICLEDIKRLPAIENIRRSRQIIQNDDNQFLPTDPKVREARKIKEKNWREAEVREAKYHDVRYKD